MICTECRDRRHTQCRGGTWCDCQHRERALPTWATVPPPRRPDQAESDNQDPLR